ncbi:hypothetical protein FGADI_924 [Fusarium gaditjirri]|uniref:Rhodopsin domain-containing protein n=1 Tax=Fusarium gaditjirri TaxID=282569 RepID=A0A8H4X3E3_9HYPO|nr:hypothetical protein FGADI_924 [Fusarium gaditjirri]
MTFLLLYYKIVTLSYWRSAYLGAIMVVVLWNICQILIFFLQCAPLVAFWNRNLRVKCVTKRLELAYVCAGINILTDIAVAILPLPVVWRLNLRRSQKIALSAVFELGCFACYCTDKMGGNVVVSYMGYRQATALGFGRGHFCAGLRVYPNI